MKMPLGAVRLQMRLVSVLLLSSAAFAGMPLPVGVCARTAEAAVQHWLAQDVTTNDITGYRVISTHDDLLAHRQWAFVGSCSGPDKPMHALVLPAGSLPAKASGTVVIHAGDSIRIDAVDGNSVIELRGEALETGAAGDVIQVRVARWNDAVEAAPVIRCRVIAAGETEWKR